MVELLVLFLFVLFGGGGMLIALMELSHNRVGPMIIFLGACLLFLAGALL